MGEYYFAFLHTHALFWVITIILFVLAVIFTKSGKKLGKIFQMSLRLFYVLMIGTGFVLIYINNFHWSTVVKGLLAIWLIFVMEFIVSKIVKKQLGAKLALILWLQFIVSFVLVMYFGYVVTG